VRFLPKSTVIAFLALTVLSAAPPTRTAEGVILSKTFRPASIYRQYTAGPRNRFWQPTDIPIAEFYVFEIKVAGISDLLRYPLNTVAAKEFKIGQRVQIHYVMRTIVPLHRRIYVRHMEPAE
jgi:hypothetical protein